MLSVVPQTETRLQTLPVAQFGGFDNLADYNGIMAKWESGPVPPRKGGGVPKVNARRRPRLPLAVSDTTLGQVVGRKLHADLVAWHNTNKVLSHPAGHVGCHNVSTFDFHAESGVSEGLCDHSFDFKSFFFLLCHKRLLMSRSWRDSE
jgi:hypothetical protein